MKRLTRHQRVAAIVLAALAIAFVTLDLGGSGLASAHGGVRGTFGALYRGTDAVLGPVRRFVQGIPGAGSNTDRIHRLERENARLRGRLHAAATDRHTVARLARLQLVADTQGRRVLPARVMGVGPGAGFDWTVTLDVGSSSGVRRGETVTDGDALVGRVLHADPSSSVVLLAADPHSGVGVRDARTGQLAVATGDGTDGFTAVPLDPHAQVAAGDRLVTGPAGHSSFAAGLTVGTVRSVHRGANGTVRASVAAATSPTALDLVGVLLTRDGHAGRHALTPHRDGHRATLAGGR